MQLENLKEWGMDQIPQEPLIEYHRMEGSPYLSVH
jgi:hypothetical protein